MTWPSTETRLPSASCTALNGLVAVKPTNADFGLASKVNRSRRSGVLAVAPAVSCVTPSRKVLMVTFCSRSSVSNSAGLEAMKPTRCPAA